MFNSINMRGIYFVFYKLIKEKVYAACLRQ